MALAPTPRFPESGSYRYERGYGPNIPGQRGPLRFEEGIATDTDVPSDFQLGMAQGYMTPPGRPNHNVNVFEKSAEETMQERAHVGSASWIEAPTFLGEFASGSFVDYDEVHFERVVRDGGHYFRANPAAVAD